MCSGPNNNRTRALSYYVVEQDGKMVDRRQVTNPKVKTTGMPKPVSHSQQRAATNHAGATHHTHHTRVASPVVQRPASKARPTTTANQPRRSSALKKISKELVAAIKADRALHRLHRHQVRKLRSTKAAKQEALKQPILPAFARSDAEGYFAAQWLKPQHAPAKVHYHSSLENLCLQYGNNPLAHELVKANAYKHSTFMAVVDLRKDPSNPRGSTIRRGAVYEPESGLNATKINIQIYLAKKLHTSQARKELRRIVQHCAELRELNVEIIGENNLAVAREIGNELNSAAGRSLWARFGGRKVDITITASIYEA